MIESWLERWQEGRIGWHEEGGNASLRKHWRAAGRCVLVPMCGKTVDMLWLEEQGNSVVGVELSDIAARAFFEENDLQYTIREGKLPAYVAEDRNITIYCGDLFDFDEPGHTGWYDRGAFVATPAEPAGSRSLRRHRQRSAEVPRGRVERDVRDHMALTLGP
jgi:thiopurine S-methyltransferase